VLIAQSLEVQEFILIPPHTVLCWFPCYIVFKMLD